MLILDDPDKLQEYVDLFNCQKGKWLIKYLMFVLGDCRLLNYSSLMRRRRKVWEVDGWYYVYWWQIN
jgi:hypothetical protein